MGASKRHAPGGRNHSYVSESNNIVTVTDRVLGSKAIKPLTESRFRCMGFPQQLREVLPNPEGVMKNKAPVALLEGMPQKVICQARVQARAHDRSTWN